MSKIKWIDNSSKFCFQFHLKSRGVEHVINLRNHFYITLDFKKSILEIYSIPKNCKLIFHDDKLSTFINIIDKSVISFGVKNHSFHKINHSSNDEIKIINSYQKK